VQNLQLRDWLNLTNCIYEKIEVIEYAVEFVNFWFLGRTECLCSLVFLQGKNSSTFNNRRFSIDLETTQTEKRMQIKPYPWSNKRKRRNSRIQM